jgi:hypothetical protein
MTALRGNYRDFLDAPDPTRARPPHYQLLHQSSTIVTTDKPTEHILSPNVCSTHQGSLWALESLCV